MDVIKAIREIISKLKDVEIESIFKDEDGIVDISFYSETVHNSQNEKLAEYMNKIKDNIKEYKDDIIFLNNVYSDRSGEWSCTIVLKKDFVNLSDKYSKYLNEINRLMDKIEKYKKDIAALGESNYYKKQDLIENLNSCFTLLKWEKMQIFHKFKNRSVLKYSEKMKFSFKLPKRFQVFEEEYYLKYKFLNIENIGVYRDFQEKDSPIYITTDSEDMYNIEKMKYENMI